jgi:hypothetical protein
MIGYKIEKAWKKLLDRIANNIMIEYSGRDLRDYISYLLEFRYPSKIPRDVKYLKEEWFEEYEEESNAG